MNMFSARTWFLVSAMFATCYPGVTASTTYTVGDVGWVIPPNTSYYQKWAANKTFVVGDTLSFNWTATHNVANVTEAEYNACTKVNSVVGDTSPVQIELKMSGDHYYICTVGPHCSLGQKLAISVMASTTNSTSPAATTSPTATTNSTSPAATTPSAASSIMSLNFVSVHVLSVAYYGAILLVLFV